LSALLLFSRWLVCSVAQLEKDSTIKQRLIEHQVTNIVLLCK
jgi:hypothetical protein